MTTPPEVERSGPTEESESGEFDAPRGGRAWRSSWQLLSYPGFRRYFLGSLGSNLGTWLQSTAQVLIAYRLTHSVFAVGLVVSAQFAGTLFVSPWAAVVADRLGHKFTLVGAQFASATIAAAMAWRYHSGVLGEHSLVVGALSLGLVFSLALPVQTALVPSLVGQEHNEAAMAMNSVSYNAGRALAPLLAVLLIATTGPDLIFFINAASFVLFGIVLATIKHSDGHAVVQEAMGRERHESPRARFLDGFRTARRNRRILLLLAIVAAVTLADDPVQVLSPTLAHTQLHVSGDWVGYFIAALGWGSVLGSLPLASRRKITDSAHTSRRAAWFLLMLAAAMVLFAAGVSALVSLLAACAAGVAALFTGAAAQAIIVGHHRRTAASVAGLWAIAWAGTKPIASLLDGWLASRVGMLSTSILLASPAAVLAAGEILLSERTKSLIKDWSLTEFLDRRGAPEWIITVWGRQGEQNVSGAPAEWHSENAPSMNFEMVEAAESGIVLVKTGVLCDRVVLCLQAVPADEDHL